MIYKIAFIIFLATISMYLFGLFVPVTSVIAGVAAGIAFIASIVEK